MKTIEINREDALEYMGSTGNVGYLWSFISYFEEKLPAEIAAFPDDIPFLRRTSYPYGECPNFAVWVRLYVEAITNKLLGSIVRAIDFKKKIECTSFRYAVNEAVAIARSRQEKAGTTATELQEMEKALRIVVELRHTFQHGGMPNILRGIQDKKVAVEDLASMLIPQKFKQTRKIFQMANKLLEVLPQPVIVGYQNGRTVLEKKDG